jgi:hypothetical protein
VLGWLVDLVETVWLALPIGAFAVDEFLGLAWAGTEGSEVATVGVGPREEVGAFPWGRVDGTVRLGVKGGLPRLGLFVFGLSALSLARSALLRFICSVVDWRLFGLVDILVGEISSYRV